MMSLEAVKAVRLKFYEEAKGTEGEAYYETSIPFTCDTCKDNDNCEFAFDAYNTDGDCLASK